MKAVGAGLIQARWIWGAVAALLVTTAQAGNGLNDVGYGSESAGMAGADLAIARDTTALNTNPAGLTQIQGQVVDLLMEPYSFLRARHKDGIGNSSGPDNGEGVALGGGYARRLGDSGVVVGIGSFFQGGAGFAYKNINTPFGNRDDMSALFGSLKLAPGIAWEANEQLSVGAAVGIIYSSARQKQFFNTSTPTFSGARIDDLSGISTNIKLGLHYRPAPNWVIALAYTSEAPLKLENGEMQLNNTAINGRILRYRDVTIKGLAFAPEVGIGVRWQASPRMLWTAEVNWLSWSSSMQQTTLIARRPDDASAAAELILPTPLDWDDQYLVAAGGVWQWTPATEVVFGASYAKQPIPRETLSPTMALLGESSLSAGFVHKFSERWRFLATGTWQPPVEVKYDNPAFGGRTAERWEALGIYLTLSRRW